MIVSPQPAAFVPPPPSTPTDRAPICARPEEVAAFRAVGLQTELMQTALSCHEEDKYGAFVTTYKTDLIRQRGVLAAYFKRAYGARWQSQYDGYITQLANAQSVHNLKSGDLYCGFADKTLDKAQTLKTTADFDTFATKVPIQQSLDIRACGSSSAPPETAPVSTGTTKHRAKTHKTHKTHTTK